MTAAADVPVPTQAALAAPLQEQQHQQQQQQPGLLAQEALAPEHTDETHNAPKEEKQEEEQEEKAPAAAAAPAAATTADMPAPPPPLPELQPVRVRFSFRFETQPGERLWMLGDAPELGSWDMARAVRLRWSKGHVWAAELELPPGRHYTYKALHQRADGEWRWQAGDNHTLVTPASAAGGGDSGVLLEPRTHDFRPSSR